MNQVIKIEDRKHSGFALQPTSMDQAMQMAEMLSSSNMVPKTYKGQPGDTLVAMMMGSELGLNPIQALQNIAVINGRPAVWGDAMLALVQNHPSFGGIEETFDEQTTTATCTVTRRGGKPHTQTYSQADAQKASLWAKTGPWTQHPKRMLSMRARGFALRNQFADALLGLITAEEALDYPAQEAPELVVNDTVSTDQVKKLEALISETGADQSKFLQFFKIQSIEELKESNFDKALRMLEQKKAK